jgi:hypothetical protein
VVPEIRRQQPRRKEMAGAMATTARGRFRQAVVEVPEPRAPLESMPFPAMGALAPRHLLLEQASPTPEVVEEEVVDLPTETRLEELVEAVEVETAELLQTSA